MPIEFAPPQGGIEAPQLQPPQSESLLSALGQAQQVQQQRAMAPLVQQGAQLDLQQKQMQMRSQQALMKAYMDAGGDPDKTLQLAGKSGQVLPEHVMGFQQHLAALAETRAKTDEATNKVVDAKHEQMFNAYGPLFAEPDDTKRAAMLPGINAALLRSNPSIKPEELLQATDPNSIAGAKAGYTTYSSIKATSEAAKNDAEAKKNIAQATEADLNVKNTKRAQAIQELQGIIDPATGLPNPADWAAWTAAHPDIKVQGGTPTKESMQALQRTQVPVEKQPEYDLNASKARMGLMGNSEYDQFLLQYAKSLGKTPAQLTPAEGLQSFQKFAEVKQDPVMRANAIAQSNIAQVLKKAQVDQMPTVEDAKMLADDIRNHRLAPDQLSAIRGRGNGSLGLMIERELKKQDPTFDWEKASSEYTLAKSPAFQQTVRYMDYVGSSLGNVIRAADQLGNGKVRSINAVKNWGANQLNGVDIAKFNTDRLEVSDAIAKILQGGGTGGGTSDMKLKQAQDLIKDTDSPQVVRTVAGEIQSLIGNRRSALTKGTYLENAQPAAATSAATVPAAVSQVLSKAGPGIHTLSDGTKWMKAADGTITKQ